MKRTRIKINSFLYSMEFSSRNKIHTELAIDPSITERTETDSFVRRRGYTLPSILATCVTADLRTALLCRFKIRKMFL